MSEQKLENFKKATIQLNEATALYKKHKNTDLLPSMRNSLIKCFEITFELSWKTLADFLRNQGIALEQTSPRAIFGKAHSTGYLKDEKLWLDLLADRNVMVHTYREALANHVAESIVAKHAKSLNELLELLDEKKN
jgi:nucleotidyltransferase substrate binding protein (TIGR01987 family)